MATDTGQRTKVTIPVTGMSCASCAATVERELGRMPGVFSIAVNYAAEKATVEYDPAEVTIKDFAKTLKDLDYGVKTENSPFRVEGITCASCVRTVSRARKK